MSLNGDLEVAETGIGQVQSPKTENSETSIHQNQKIIPPRESTRNSSPFQKILHQKYSTSNFLHFLSSFSMQCKALKLVIQMIFQSWVLAIICWFILGVDDSSLREAFSDFSKVSLLEETISQSTKIHQFFAWPLEMCGFKLNSQVLSTKLSNHRFLNYLTTIHVLNQDKDASSFLITIRTV